MSSGNTKSGVRNIALQAGVSIATVSRVLNGSESVSSSTRDRVNQVLQETGYRPNAAAKALATNRTRTIAAILPTLRHSLFALFLDAFEDELAKAGFNLVVATHQFDPETEFKRCNEVLHLGAEAIVVSGADHNSKFFNTFNAADIPCMFISVHESDQSFPTFGYDNRKLGESAIEFLAALGHREIQVIHGPTLNNDRMADRVEGVRTAGEKNTRIKLVLNETELGVGGGSAVAREWFSSGDLPHACLCLADVLALGVIFEANRQKVKIPEQMSLMGFENVDWAQYSSPSLTTIDLPAIQMGRAAAIALVDCLDHGKPLGHRQFDSEIIQRDSTRQR